MQDAITAVINSSDVQGKYLDASSLEKLKGYFQTGELRVRAASTISANAAAIVKEAVAKSLLYSDVTRPGGNMYTTSLCSLHSRLGLLPALFHLRNVGWRPLHPR
jgi:allophycocyanin beta subunit